jgi:hypothetical protein
VSGVALKAPAAIGVRIITKPQRPTNIRWLVVCRSPAGSVSSRGTAKPLSSRVTNLRLPTPKPATCLVQVSVEVSRPSNITLSILYR